MIFLCVGSFRSFHSGFGYADGSGGWSRVRTVRVGIPGVLVVPPDPLSW